MPVSCRPLLVALSLMVFSVSAFAQGSLIPPGAGSREPGGGDPRSRRPDPPDYRKYELGKEAYAVKLGCETCPLGDKPLDEATARRFLNDPTLGITASLTDDEQEAVTLFLKQRFGLLF